MTPLGVVSWAALALVLVALPLDTLRTAGKLAWRDAALALGPLALAVALRLVWLGSDGLEHLEASYLFESIKPPGLHDLIFSRQAGEQMHQPLYPLLLRGLADLTLDPGGLRLPSVMAGAWTVALVMALAEARIGRAGALVAGVLVAIAPLGVWYGRDASPYALLSMLALVGYTSFDQALTSQARWPAVRAGIAFALAVYTHFHGAWIAVAGAVWAGSLGRAARPAALRTVATGVVLLLPAVPLLFDKLFVSVVGLREDQPLVRYSHAWPEALGEAARLLGGGTALTGTVVLLICLGAVAMTWRSHPITARLAACGVVASVLAEAHVLWQLSVAKGIVYVDVRHYGWLVPLLALPVAAAATALWHRSTLGRGLAIALVAALVSANGVTTSTLLHTERPAVARAVAVVSSHATPRDAIAFLPAPWYQPMIELALFGRCLALTHGRHQDGWWRREDCGFEEQPRPDTVFGFPWTPERMRQTAQRHEIDRLWVIDIRDHRFGLAAPPTTPQEAFHCWRERDTHVAGAVRWHRALGPWVTVWLLDARALAQAAPPPTPSAQIRVVRSAEAWPIRCDVD